MINNVKFITFSSFLSMFFLGVASAVIGAAARNIGLSPAQIGLLIAVQNLGFIFSVSLSGALADRYEKPKILMVGSLILAISFLTFYRSDLFLVNCIVMLFIGVGVGTYEGVSDAMLLAIHQERESMYIGVNHFFVTLGSLLITVYLIFLQMNWQYSVVQSGVVVLLLAGCFGLIKLQNKSAPAEGYGAILKVLTRDRLVVVLFILTILAVGMEMGSIGILTTYLMELRGFSQVTSKLGLVTFLAGIASGRLLIGFLVRKEQLAHYLLALFGLGTIFFTGLYLANLGWFTYGVIFLAGGALSAALPLMITLAGLVYKEMAGTVLGAIKVAIPIGGMLIPFLISMLSSHFSFQVSLLIFPLTFLVGFVVLLLEVRQLAVSRGYQEVVGEPETYPYRG